MSLLRLLAFSTKACQKLQGLPRRQSFTETSRYFARKPCPGDEVVEKTCEEKCQDPGLKKIKDIQKRFAENAACPVWLLAGSDKALYYLTMGLALVGLIWSLTFLLTKAFFPS